MIVSRFWIQILSTIDFKRLFALLQLIEDLDTTAAETSDRGTPVGPVLQTPMVKVATKVIKKKEMRATHLPGIDHDTTTDVDTILVGDQRIKLTIVPLIDQEMKLNLTPSRRKNKRDDRRLEEIDADPGMLFNEYLIAIEDKSIMIFCSTSTVAIARVLKHCMHIANRADNLFPAGNVWANIGNIV